jgi:N-acetylmuramoyl-L-alanine amidase
VTTPARRSIDPAAVRAVRPIIAVAIGAALLTATGCGPTQGGDAPPLGGAASDGPSAPSDPPEASGSDPSPDTETGDAGTTTEEAVPEPDEVPEPAEPLAGLVVAIDPGHNGGNAAAPDVVNRPVDAGGFDKPCNTTGAATDDGHPEHRVNHDLALALRERLESRGASVELTRETDDGVGPCIDERGGFAAVVGADVLVSLHADGGPAGGSGFHVIHPLTTRSVAPDEVVGRSEELAVTLRDTLVDAGFATADYVARDGLSPRDDLGTLNLAAVPAVLLEAGNLRNADDAHVLTSTEGQSRLADAVVAALEAFLAP